jgi:hypothetical protein
MDRSSKKPSSQRRPRPPPLLPPPPPYEDTEEPETSNRPQPIIIAVFGKTGTGKSSFIKGVTGKDLKIGHGLESCQQI